MFIRRVGGFRFDFGARTDLTEMPAQARADARREDGQDKRVDPQQLQVQLTGFLNKQAQPFVAEL